MRALRSHCFSPLMAVEKIKILGAVLELNRTANPAQLPQKLGQMGWIGSAVLMVAPKRPPEFWFLQLPWVPNLHFSWNPLLSGRPHFSCIIILLWLPCGANILWSNATRNSNGLGYMIFCYIMQSFIHSSVTNQLFDYDEDENHS